MAEKEKRTIRIKEPSEQKSKVSEWASFGWVLVDAYDIKKEGTARSPSYHHVELNFERDPEIPHYNELAALEKSYSAKAPKWPEFNILITVVIAVPILFFGYGGDFQFRNILLSLVPGVVIFLIRLFVVPLGAEKERLAILKQAQELSRG